MRNRGGIQHSVDFGLVQQLFALAKVSRLALLVSQLVRLVSCAFSVFFTSWKVRYGCVGILEVAALYCIAFRFQPAELFIKVI